ncbi:MAG: hypothetical protein AAFY20_15135 [Cyanobacteria bacterium J06639_14]
MPKDRALKKAMLSTIAVLAIGSTGWYVGALTVARFLPEKSPYAWGFASGALPVAAIAGIAAAQSIKDRRDELEEMRQRISEVKGDLGIATRARDDLQAECFTLKKQVQAVQERLQDEKQRSAHASKVHEGAIAYAKQLDARLEATKGELLVWEKRVADLNSKIGELEIDNQEWEAEFEDRLQALFELEKGDERAKARAEMQAKYQQLVKQFEQKKPAHIQKRVEREVLKRLEQFQGDYDEAVSERDRALADLQAIKGEFGATVSQLQDELDESELIERLEAQVVELQESIENKDRAILDLRSKIVKLEEPRTFPGSYGFHRGNVLINYALSRGVVLDAVERHQRTDQGIETYTFAQRHHEPVKQVLSTLNGDVAELQFKLDSKSLVTFEYDSERLLFKASVRLFKKQVTRDEVDRLWLKHSKFKALLKGVCAFRVSANKGGSKSPTVRNILGAKLLEGEKFEIRRYDPSAGSRKDFWRIAPKWRSYDDAVALAFEILGLINTRQRAKKTNRGVEFPWIYFCVDELDNTVSDRNLHKIEFEGEEISQAKLLMDAIAKVVKEGEHLNIGIIICTQTPNVRQLMKSETIDKAFFNNLTQIVVEGNVFDYLANGTDQTKSAKLASDYRTVYDWCDKENDAITDEARKYRPALFISKAKREIIELPPLGKFGFDKLDPTQQYEFENFDAHQFGEIRSLDQALLQSGGGVQLGVQQGATKRPPTQEMRNAGGGQNYSSATVTKSTSIKESTKKCPICGVSLKSGGIVKSGTHKGQRKLVCRNPKHDKRMGAKTYYAAVESDE